jgi:hypothetical protein
VGSAAVQVIVEPAGKSDGGPDDDLKFNREWKAFHDMLPELMQKYGGQYVAIHEGKVVGSGLDGAAVSLKAHQQFGNVPIVVREVTDRPRAIRIGPSYRRVSS